MAPRHCAQLLSCGAPYAWITSSLRERGPSLRERGQAVNWQLNHALFNLTLKLLALG